MEHETLAKPAAMPVWALSDGRAGNERQALALAAALGWPLPKVLATLTEYEVEGRIAAEHGVWMVRR